MNRNADINEGGPRDNAVRSHRTHACDSLPLPHVVSWQSQDTTSSRTAPCA
jgi:hypothetical protein